MIIYSTEEENAETIVKVPDFTGMTVGQASTAAYGAGLNIKLSGNTASGSAAIAYDQDIEKNTEAKIGTTVTVYFREASTTD